MTFILYTQYFLPYTPSKWSLQQRGLPRIYTEFPIKAISIDRHLLTGQR